MAEDWLNPLNGLKLQMAVRFKRKHVTFDLHDPDLKRKRGITFDLTYEGERFYIKPSPNQGPYFALAPCGWFETERVLEDRFLERDKITARI